MNKFLFFMISFFSFSLFAKESAKEIFYEDLKIFEFESNLSQMENVNFGELNKCQNKKIGTVFGKESFVSSLGFCLVKQEISKNDADKYNKFTKENGYNYNILEIFAKDPDDIKEEKGDKKSCFAFKNYDNTVLLLKKCKNIFFNN